MLLAFDGLSRPVELIESDELVAGFSAVLRGWHFAEVPSATAPPLITLRRTAKGYALASPWRSAPERHGDAVDAVCSFIVDLVKAYIADDTSLLCLHCAAAEFAGRLVVFPSTYRAGKSTLCAYLAASGVRLFADDVLPIRESGNRGVAPGIAPRLRLPLPDTASPAFRDFVRCRQGLGNKRYLYLDLDTGGLAPLGAEAPIGGFVVLRREPGVKPELVPASKSEILKSAIVRNFAHDVQAVDILGRLHDLVEDARCFTLRYADAEQAVALLSATFGCWPSSPSSEARGGPTTPETANDAPADTVLPSQLRRNAGVVAREVDQDIFLVDPDSQAIYQLNAVGAALWRLLEEPIRVDDVIDVLRAAFPDVARRQIESDVNGIVSDLVERGLANVSAKPDAQGAN